MDDIINIDECLSDSFSLSSDTDIRNIVDQWKHNDAITDNKDNKYVDTRTFTRPKRRTFSGADVGNALNSTHLIPSSAASAGEPTVGSSNSQDVNGTTPQINLQIGGLVTSMQRSFLNDVSPPATILMESSIEPMGNSLISSSDFSNINEFMNSNADSLSMAQFNQYRLTDAIKDRNFLERLTNYDESWFTKDADINNIDSNHLLENGSSGSVGNGSGSGNSTLQNSTDSSTNFGRHDETFIPMRNDNANETFAADKSMQSNRTFVQVPLLEQTSVVDNKNGTFDLDTAKNTTFDAAEKKTIFAGIADETMDNLASEELSLHGTFNAGANAEYMPPDSIGNATMNCLNKNIDVGSPILKDYSTNVLSSDVAQSTPARGDIFRNSRRTESLANISPILTDDVKVSGNRKQPQNVDKFIDVEIDDFPVYLRSSSTKSSNRTSNPMGTMNLRDEERQSLANFEEFENTLLMLENNKNEEEFDDLLNSFSNSVRNPTSQKLRQSLDSIKKRHSLINQEKQQQDELRKEKAFDGTFNGNRMIESFNRGGMVSSTSSSGSGSGERLLRRSRLYDDMNALSISSDRINGENNANDQLTSGSTSAVGNDSKSSLPNDQKTEFLNRKNQSYLQKDSNKTDNLNQYNNKEIPATDACEATDTKTSNRDRFKTIRIFKKPPENAVQVSDADQPIGSCVPISLEKIEHFTERNSNSPKMSMNADDNLMAEMKAINTMTFKKSALARPKYLSGISKRDSYAKSSSHEMLLDDDLNQKTFSSGMDARKGASALKSPMGVKSKSIHNLLGSNRLANQRGDDIENSSRLGRPSMAFTSGSQNNASNVFKIPANKPSAILRQAAGAPRKLTLVRPSSGYYGYNTKRIDSDTESGRFSSNNSLSSGSSKGSLNRPEPESGANMTFVGSNDSKLGSAAPSRTTAAAVPSNVLNGNVPRASGLRPPTQIRKSGLPRPTAFSKR